MRRLLAAALLSVAAAACADSGAVPLQRIALGELGGWIALEASVGGHTGRLRRQDRWVGSGRRRSAGRVRPGRRQVRPPPHGPW